MSAWGISGGAGRLRTCGEDTKVTTVNQQPDRRSNEEERRPSRPSKDAAVLPRSRLTPGLEPFVLLLMRMQNTLLHVPPD